MDAMTEAFPLDLEDSCSLAAEQAASLASLASLATYLAA